MFGNLQGINPMVISASLVDNKNKQFFTNMKTSPTALILNTKTLQGSYPIEICAPWEDSYFHNQINQLNLDRVHQKNVY